MPIKIAGLVDWEGFKKKSEKQQEDLKHERGFSKSGLDWDQPDDPDAPQTWEDMAEDEKPEGDLVNEWGLDEDGDEDGPDERSLKAMIKAIHKHAAELYNIVDEMDEPEEWVLEKAKDCAAKIAEIHSHIDYNKDKAEELGTTPGADSIERGW